MKINIKILKVFVFTTVLSLILSIIIGISIVGVFDKGDQTRNAGRINALTKRISGESNKINSSSMNYSNLKAIENRLSGQYKIDNAEQITNRKRILGNDGIAIKLFYDSNLEVSEKYVDDSAIEINEKQDIESIIEMFKSNYISNKPLKGIYGGDTCVFIVASEFVKGPNNTVNGAVLLIKPLDNSFISSVNDEVKRTASLVTKIDEDGEINIIEEDGETTKIVEANNYVKAYRKIDVIEGTKQYYIEQTEERLVRNQAIGNLIYLISVLFIAQIFVNIFLYKLIKQKIVDRVVKINSSVNKIIKTNDVKNRLNEDDFKDEISVLATDINTMLYNIDETKSELIKNTEELTYMVNYDTLTGLYNRHYLLQYIAALINNNDTFAAYFIDIDNFKSINDTAGHSNGDKVLCLVANELKRIQNDFIKVGRLGGDEFLVIISYDNIADKVLHYGELILNHITQTVVFDSLKFNIEASVGASLYPKQAKSTNEILQYSDIAMYKSKNSGKNRFAVFDNEMYEEILLGAKIKQAIEKSELVPYYQPIYDVRTSKIIGAEALVRWDTGTTILVPDLFLRIAKKNGDIIQLDRFMLDKAVAYCRSWIDKGVCDFQVSINISYMFLKQSNFENEVVDILNKYNVMPENIKLEITEDEIITDIVSASRVLSKLREIGVKVSLDDFGTGYSSFNYIKTLPLDTIKIDKSLLLSLDSDSKTMAIINTLIKLCHELDLNVICEGVEDETQLSILEKLNCNMIQGYIISPPVPKEKFNDLVERYNYV